MKLEVSVKESPFSALSCSSADELSPFLNQLTENFMDFKNKKQNSVMIVHFLPKYTVSLKILVLINLNKF